MRIPSFKISALLILILMFSCNTDIKKSELKMVNVIDLNGKFQVKLPENWKKEFNTTESSSGIISSDTARELKNKVIINVNWNLDTVYINPNLEQTLDSLNATVGLKTQMQKSGKIRAYRTSFNFSSGYDSTEKMQRNQYLYVLKKDSIKGYILMTATIFGDSILTEQSELVAEIVKTIKMNK
ncbi:hypothetical protein [Mangrovibacterium diazotrophicum]|uniref:PsbP protein n=1 Tax=Mangrovibacterium diazotrophicum TaxID=1261403 RepID=A0A419VY33_9BACT|nr:hypothetical protein [Mangrovibacterium diazotrophicum]RKD88151.1 hypothetical protein BC643_3294 [Mangrovibacterium diazotrophicum]